MMLFGHMENDNGYDDDILGFYSIAVQDMTSRRVELLQLCFID